jgi:hypothetical protein
MDLIFEWALGMAKTGGLDSGELFFVASRISDSDPRSWSTEFETYGTLPCAATPARRCLAQLGLVVA